MIVSLKKRTLVYWGEMLPDPSVHVARVWSVCMRLTMVCATLASIAAAHADDIARTGGPYVPTPQEVVDRMLQFADVGPQDYVIDLGSGDGRMVITAARHYGARGLGVEIDPELVERSRAEAQRLGIADRVQFRVEDATQTSVTGASVITLYLLPGLTQLLVPRFMAQLKPGSHIVAHDFDLGKWRADRRITIDVKEKYGSTGTWKSTLFLYTVPASVAGAWQIESGGPHAERMVVRFEQHYQEITGSAVLAGRSYVVSLGRVNGTHVQFRLGADGAAAGYDYEGELDGGTMRGVVQGNGARSSWSARRLTAVD